VRSAPAERYRSACSVSGPRAGRCRRTRCTGWGNPFSLEHLLGSQGEFYTEETGLDRILADFEAWALKMLEKYPDWLAPLKGKHLCCWCREGKKCHADILLKLANA
jgi:hypothetical protein